MVEKVYKIRAISSPDSQPLAIERYYRANDPSEARKKLDRDYEGSNLEFVSSEHIIIRN